MKEYKDFRGNTLMCVLDFRLFRHIGYCERCHAEACNSQALVVTSSATRLLLTSTEVVTTSDQCKGILGTEMSGA